MMGKDAKPSARITPRATEHRLTQQLMRGWFAPKDWKAERKPWLTWMPTRIPKTT